MLENGWLGTHWFDLLQSGGIIAGFVFTANASRKEEKTQKLGNLTALTKHHREIWRELYQRPDLKRVLSPEVDLQSKPITEEEHLFVTLLILHLGNVFYAIEEGLFMPVEGIQRDISEFFALPIPKAVFERSRSFQNRDFVEFIESALPSH